MITKKQLFEYPDYCYVLDKNGDLLFEFKVESTYQRPDDMVLISGKTYIGLDIKLCDEFHGIHNCQELNFYITKITRDFISYKADIEMMIKPRTELNPADQLSHSQSHCNKSIDS